jgi:hypothetical protein
MQIIVTAKHLWGKECQLGAQKYRQQEAAISLALALQTNFTAREDNNIQVLEKVKVFKYLGQILAQDDDNNDNTQSVIKYGKLGGHGQDWGKS